MPKIDTSQLSIHPTRPYPPGASPHDNGVTFNIFSRHAERVWLAVFENVGDESPLWEYEFDPLCNRIGDIWSMFVANLPADIFYMYRMAGPWNPKAGHRFDEKKYLLDPYARGFVGDVHKGTMKSVAIEERINANLQSIPRTPMKDTIIYETHVRGFTVDPSSGVTHPGTYCGLKEKIPYLLDLGVTAVELLPVQEFGETCLARKNPMTGEELTNYWGYSNVGFFAPAARYACSATAREHVDEFRDMVDALHEAGLEVILDVVFNHTSEGNELGPTLCFRGIDNAIYYMLDKEGGYLNYSGCGNTVHCDHPLVRDFILDCLRYWVAFMHIDGFRFDLASILGRTIDGLQEDAPLVQRIAEDPLLQNVKLIAEAWDAGGAYQVGSFGGIRWAEWNGRYRDDVRRYWLGAPDSHRDFATRISGSSDLYQWADRTPMHSVNFITCHDGFTLRDLVSYEEKHNLANGEENRDGSNDNLSMNCGVEGETADPRVNELRLRMQKNHIATLMLSLGVPMLLGGDEFGRTQQGNNNAFCQDNEISWFNWGLLGKNDNLYQFCKGMIAFRKANPACCRNQFFNGMKTALSEDDVDMLWKNPRGGEVQWHGADTALACRIHGRVNAGYSLYCMFNNTDAAKTFILRPGVWQLRVDTAQCSQGDHFIDPDTAPVSREAIVLVPKSLVVMSQKITLF